MQASLKREMRTHDAREAHIDCVYKKTEESLVNSNGRAALRPERTKLLISECGTLSVGAYHGQTT